MLCMFLRELWLFLGWLGELCLVLVCVAVACIRMATVLVAGVADCYFAQGLLWLIPSMPREAFINALMVIIDCSMG